MCLYMGVAEHLVDILTFCVCRAIEMSIFVLMMTCGITLQDALEEPPHVIHTG
ncbi:uncharacterized protein prim [Calliphora vicina]|uniref:uncharacterized protein prim n=1 Tax=Calliphora vicina TaxID=7373 RepID=UPI00325B22DD